jgi:hypothetical protein
MVRRLFTVGALMNGEGVQSFRDTHVSLLPSDDL